MRPFPWRLIFRMDTLKVCAVFALLVAVVYGNTEAAAEHQKCWSEDCDNKLRDCAKDVVHCTDKCHHGCMKAREVCEHGEVQLHHKKTPFAARRNCHDKNYNCIFECFHKCGKESTLQPCVHAAERHCYDTCAHEHADDHSGLGHH